MLFSLKITISHIFDYFEDHTTKKNKIRHTRRHKLQPNGSKIDKIDTISTFDISILRVYKTIVGQQSLQFSYLYDNIPSSKKII